jgi:hypothetical protein
MHGWCPSTKLQMKPYHRYRKQLLLGFEQPYWSLWYLSPLWLWYY